MSLFKGEEENLKIKMVFSKKAFHLRKDTSDIFSGKVADNSKDSWTLGQIYLRRKIAIISVVHNQAVCKNTNSASVSRLILHS